MSNFKFKDQSLGEINPSRFFKKKLDLFTNICPARTYAGLPVKLGTFDLVVVRENTEGLCADRNMELGSSEMQENPDLVVTMWRITRVCYERFTRSAFELAMTRKNITIVHKADVFALRARDVSRHLP
jgi:3-isopropylmalate dehydrogenase